MHGYDTEYLLGDKRHPRDIDVRVRPGRFFNGPMGERVGPLGTTRVAEVELKPNAAILVRCGSDEERAILQRYANRGSGAVLAAERGEIGAHKAPGNDDAQPAGKSPGARRAPKKPRG